MTVVTTSIMMLIPNKRMYRNAPSSFRSKRTKVYKKTHSHTCCTTPQTSTAESYYYRLLITARVHVLGI